MKRGGGKSRPVRKAADVPTSLLDAYTESQTTSAMSDSDKFKEGYVKKKDKGKQKRTSKKSETEEETEQQESKEEEMELKESWEEEEVIESWETLEVEEMPVPQKVKQVMRKEEKKRKKEEKKAAEKEQEKDSSGTSLEREGTTEEEVKVEKAESLAEQIADLSLEKNDGKKKEFSEEEKSAIMAEREAKKAAKAMKKATSKEGKEETPGGVTGGVTGGAAGGVTEGAMDTKDGEKPAVTEGEKTKAQLKAERKAQFELQQQKLKDSAQPGTAEKSKADLKAERRAKQEAQRKAKAEAEEKKTAEKKAPVEDKKIEKKKEKKAPAGPSSVGVKGKTQRQVGLFSHLHQYERGEAASRKVPLVGGNIHPAIISLGLQHADGQVVGSSGRCISLLLALKSVLLDNLPLLFSSEELYKDVDNLIKTNLTFLRQVPSVWITFELYELYIY